MEKGVPYLERGERDVTPLYEPSKSKKGLYDERREITPNAQRPIPS
jgi:hypothetical protein